MISFYGLEDQEPEVDTQVSALRDVLSTKEPSSRGVLGFMQDTAVDLGKSAIGLGESVVGLADILSGNLAGQALEAIGYQPKKSREILEAYYSDARRAANKNVEDAKGFADTTIAYLQNPSALIGGLVESSLGNIGLAGVSRAVATSMLSKAGINLAEAGGKEAASKFLQDPQNIMKIMTASAIGEGAQTSGSIQEQARQAGREYSDSVLPAIAGGVGTGGISLIANKVGAKIPFLREAGDAETNLALSGMRTGRTWPDAIKDTAKSMFKEGVFEEMPQSWQEQIFTNLSLGRQWDEGISEAAAAGLVMGAAQAGGMTGVSRIHDKINDYATATPIAQQNAIVEVQKIMADPEAMSAMTEDTYKKIVTELVLLDKQRPNPELEATIAVFREKADRDAKGPKATFQPELGSDVGPQNSTETTTPISTIVSENNVPSNDVVDANFDVVSPLDSSVQTASTNPESFKNNVEVLKTEDVDKVSNVVSLENELGGIIERMNSKSDSLADRKRYDEINMALASTPEYSAPKGWGILTPDAEKVNRIDLANYQSAVEFATTEEEEEVASVLMGSVAKELEHFANQQKGVATDAGRITEHAGNKSSFVRVTVEDIQRTATEENKELLRSEGHSDKQIADAITNHERTPERIKFSFGKTENLPISKLVNQVPEEPTTTMKSSVDISQTEDKDYAQHIKGQATYPLAEKIMDSVAKRFGYEVWYHASKADVPVTMEDKPIYLARDPRLSRLVAGKNPKKYYIKLDPDRIKKVRHGGASHLGSTTLTEKEAKARDRKIQRWINQGYDAAMGSDDLTVTNKDADLTELLIFRPFGKILPGTLIIRDSMRNAIPPSQRFMDGNLEVKLTSKDEGKKNTYSVEQVQTEVSNITSKIKEGLKIEVVPDTMALPVEVIDYLRQKGRLYSNGESGTMGMFYNGKVYVVANNMTSKADIGMTVLHELTHKGIGNLFELLPSDGRIKSIRNDYNTLMDAIYDAKKEEVDKIASTTHTHYDLSKEEDRRALSEEWLCNQKYTAEKAWYDKLVAVARDIMRYMGFKMALSNSEIRVVLEDAFGTFGRLNGHQVRSMSRTVKEMVAAWHGGGELEGGRFDPKYIGSAQGLGVGHGFYFSDLESVGRHYAELAAKAKESGSAWQLDKLRKYFVPGTIVSSYGGRDRVISFHESPADSLGLKGLGEWAVVVHAVDENGKDKLYERNRIHSTAPSQKEYERVTGEKISKNLYKVSLHKGKGPGQYSWLDWDKPISESNQKKIISLMKKEGYTEEGVDDWAGFIKKSNGDIVYKMLSSRLGSSENASAFLLRAGIDGNRVPVGYFGGNQVEGKYNYVVFDPDAITIDEHIKFSFSAEESERMYQEEFNQENEDLNKESQEARDEYEDTIDEDELDGLYSHTDNQDDYTEEDYDSDMQTEEEVDNESQRLLNEYNNTIRVAFEMPEMVSLVKGVGSRIKLMKYIGKNVLGSFNTETGIIKLLRTMTTKQMLKTLAHEIGHLHDWLKASGQQNQISKGGLLAKIAAFLDYRKQTLAEFFNSSKKALSAEDRARFKKEANQFVQNEGEDEVTWVKRVVPEYAEVGVTPEQVIELMKGEVFTPKQVLDYLKSVDGPTKAAIVKQAFKGILMSPISEMVERTQIGTKEITEEIRTPNAIPFNERVAAKYSELIQEEIEKRRLFQNSVIKEELVNLTQEIKPFDTKANAKYTKYRYSPAELYADAMSVFLNDPAMLKDKAPTFNRALFNYFERRPEFAKLYNDIQTLLKDEDALANSRWENLGRMSEEGAKKRSESFAKKLEEQRITASKVGYWIRKYIDNKNIAYVKKVNEWLASGKTVKDWMRIDYWMEKLPYIDSEVFLFYHQANKIIEAAKKDGIDLKDLHSLMVLQRITNDPKRRVAAGDAMIVSAGGHTGETAEATLKRIKEAWITEKGEKSWDKMLRYADDFRDNFQKSVVDVIDKQKFIPPSLMKFIRNNPYYVTFHNTELEKALEGSYGEHTAKIYNQYGGVNDIDNVLVATMMKGAALIRAARYQETKVAILHSLIENDPGSVIQAKRGEDGREIIKVPEGMGQIHVVELVNKPIEGTRGPTKVVSRVNTYYIDKELADAWEKSPERADPLMRLGMMTKWIITKLFIQYNIPWIVANPIRDMLGTYKKNPEASISMVLRAYKSTFMDAMRSGWDMMPEIEKKLLRDRVIPSGMSWGVNGLENGIHTQEEFLLRERGLIAEKKGFYAAAKRLNLALQSNGMDKLLVLPYAARVITRTLSNLGKAGERWGKFAGSKMQEEIAAKHRKMAKNDGDANLPGDLERGHQIIQNSGTPNSFAEGLATRYAEILFPFSRIAIQDMMGSAEAIKNGRNAYILKTLLINVLPKVAIAAAMIGALGPELEDKAKKIPAYFRRMYSIVPLGVPDFLEPYVKEYLPDMKDQTVFLKIPQDYTGQAVGAIVDSIMSGNFTGTLGTLGAVASYQPFNANPFITTVMDWVKYYAAHEVPTNFYGNKIMTEREAQAGGSAAALALGRATWNDFFGGLLYRFQGDGIEKIEPEIKKLIGIAGFNAIGKYIGISDSGIAEESRLIVADTKQKKAVEVLGIRKDIIDKINKSDENITREDLMDYWSAAVDQGKIDPKKQPFNSFANNYMALAAKKTGGPYINAYEIATTNEEKAALLDNWKKNLSPDKYEKVVDSLQSYNLLKRGALKEQAMNEEKQSVVRSGVTNDLRNQLLQSMLLSRRRDREVADE